jgi:Ser/Thr protein kinase RdoA (MazF antagonist)
LAAALPALKHWDAQRGLLVVDLVWPGETLSARRLRLGAPEPSLAGVLGTTLAGIHRSTAGSDAISELAGEPPWALQVLQLDRVEWAWSDPSISAVLAGLPNRDAVAETLLKASEQWKERCLVHADVRSENCLVDERPHGQRQVKLIDWELALRGDPAWDVGCALAELAAPLGGTHLARRALWEAYLETARLMPGPAERFTARMVLYAGARLIQTALEYGRRDGPGTPPVRALLELAAATLTDPDAQLPALLGGAPVPSRERHHECVPCARHAQVA